VREAVRALRASPYRAPSSGRTIDLLVFGGSQGAASFSQVVPETLCRFAGRGTRPPARGPAVRPEDLERVRARYAEAGIPAELAPFFADLPRRLAGAIW